MKNVQTGETFFVECDSVVNGIGFVPTPVGGKTASRKVKGRETIHRVGDCVAIGKDLTVSSVQDGKLAAIDIDRTLRA